jgi:hypothetical protein
MLRVVSSNRKRAKCDINGEKGIKSTATKCTVISANVACGLLPRNQTVEANGCNTTGISDKTDAHHELTVPSIAKLPSGKNDIISNLKELQREHHQREHHHRSLVAAAIAEIQAMSRIQDRRMVEINAGQDSNTTTLATAMLSNLLLPVASNLYPSESGIDVTRITPPFTGGGSLDSISVANHLLLHQQQHQQQVNKRMRLVSTGTLFKMFSQ